ncbi:hypothetical protein ABZX73_16915 [Brevibacterium casei]
MAFEPNKWADGAEGGTPVTAEELNRIEDSGAAAAKTGTWGQVANRPSGYPPASHDHQTSEVVGLDSQLASILARLDSLEANILS